MPLSLKEMQYILIIAIASLVGDILNIYINYIAPTVTSATTLTTLYVWSGPIASVISLAEKMDPTPFLYYTDWAFTFFDAAYVINNVLSSTSTLMNSTPYVVLYWFCLGIEYLAIFALYILRYGWNFDFSL